MLGYINDISPICRVSEMVDTIFRGEKSEGRYFRKYCQNIGDISEINRWFFGDNFPLSCNVIWRPKSRPCWFDDLDVIPMVIWRSNCQIAPTFLSNGQNWFATEINVPTAILAQISFINSPNFIYFIHFCFHSSFVLSLLQFLLRLLNYLIVLRYICFKL